MTCTALRAAGALLLLSTLPAFAAAPVNAVQPAEILVKAPPASVTVTPRPVPKPPSPTAAALTAAVTEITAGRASGTYAQWLDTLPGFRFSPATSALLVKQLGTDKLFSVRRQEAPGGGRDYLVTAPALRHAGPGDSSISWETIHGTMQLQADGRAIANQFTAPRVTLDDKTMRVDIRALTGSATSIDSDSPYGDVAGAIGSVQMLMKPDGSTIGMDGLFAKFAITERADSASMLYETGMRTLTVQAERLDDLHLAMRFNGMDKAALEKSHQLGKQLQEQQGKLGKASTPAQRSALILPVLRQFGMAALARGAVIDLDDLSFAYHGSTARMHGQVRMENLARADLEQPAVLLKKVVVHADIAVPVALLRAFADGMASKQLAKQQPGADAATIAKLGAALYDGMLKAALANGYVRIEGDMLLTSIDVRDGIVLINGKPLPMPRPGAPVVAVNSSAGMMRARRIAEKCMLPDFPPEVVAQDRALSLALQLTVNADGSVGKPALARSSGWPAYDQAVLAAAASCTYIPALRNGQPVPVSELWEVVRAPGSTRP
jgi:TonB family protein